jgi:hypothetical protein
MLPGLEGVTLISSAVSIGMSRVSVEELEVIFPDRTTV